MPLIQANDRIPSPPDCPPWCTQNHRARWDQFEVWGVWRRCIRELGVVDGFDGDQCSVSLSQYTCIDRDDAGLFVRVDPVRVTIGDCEVSLCGCAQIEQLLQIARASNTPMQLTA